MTRIVDHKIFRYTWELVRHTYIVDLESEIEIQQIELTPSQQNHLLGPPYPLTPFFEIEIDQIQKNGKTVFSFRTICPVQIDQKTSWDFMNGRIRVGGSSRVTHRFQSPEAGTETRWLYTDDFFLISLSSGDRHDLGMLLSLIFEKLNMIALSIRSGRRISSEFENQQKYRAAMSTMFSEGVDGAFRDVPVYQQHGEMTDTEIDMSAVLMSAELQDLTEECASEKPAGTESVLADAVVPAGIPEGVVPGGKTLAEPEGTEPAPAEKTREENNPSAHSIIRSIPAGEFSDKRPSATGGTATGPAPGPDSAAQEVRADSNPAERTGPVSCSSCGTEISRTAKFCGGCGAAVSTAAPAEYAHGLTRMNAPGGVDLSPTSSQPAAGPVVNLKTIEELDDLSWLSD